MIELKVVERKPGTHGRKTNLVKLAPSKHLFFLAFLFHFKSNRATDGSVTGHDASLSLKCRQWPDTTSPTMLLTYRSKKVSISEKQRIIGPVSFT